MSLPHLLLVDDSEAILAYEKAALAGEYTFSTATDGLEALKKALELRPAAILLDLSMPMMSGDEVLIRIKASPDLRQIPVIVISSEKSRAQQCLEAGAAAFLPKPIKADEVKATVARVLSEARKSEREGSLAALLVGVGPFNFGVPLDCVHRVLLHPATQPIAAGPSFLKDLVDLHGTPVPVLDLARSLRVEHSVPLVDRRLVVVSDKDLLLAVSVDRVRDPEEFAPDNIIWRTRFIGDGNRMLSESLKAILLSSQGAIPVIEPTLLWSRKLIRRLPIAFKQVASGEQLGAIAG